MPTYVVGVKSGLSETQFADARKAVEQKGGKIVSGPDDFKRDGLSPGFEVSFPANSVTTLESIPHFQSVEESKQFSTQ